MACSTASVCPACLCVCVCGWARARTLMVLSIAALCTIKNLNGRTRIMWPDVLRWILVCSQRHAWIMFVAGSNFRIIHNWTTGHSRHLFSHWSHINIYIFIHMSNVYILCIWEKYHKYCLQTRVWNWMLNIVYSFWITSADLVLSFLFPEDKLKFECYYTYYIYCWLVLVYIKSKPMHIINIFDRDVLYAAHGTFCTDKKWVSQSQVIGNQRSAAYEWWMVTNIIIIVWNKIS